jgi:kynurenine formamidase
LSFLFHHCKKLQFQHFRGSQLVVLTSYFCDSFVIRIRRFVDLSVPLMNTGNGVAADPPGMVPEIVYVKHQVGAEQMVAMFPGLKREDLPDAEGWAVEALKITTHNGTHMDAPWHFASTMDGGKPAMHIDEVPLEWCFAPGVKLDFRAKPDGHVVSAAEVEAEFERIGHTLRALEIVLINTSAGEAYGRADYLDRGCGLGREATLWLLARGVRVVGTDAWSWDAPFSFTRKRFAETGDPSIIWEGHKAGRDIGYCQMEKLANLHLLPPNGFWVSCFPYKIKSASAGFTRAVALFEDLESSA